MKTFGIIFLLFLSGCGKKKTAEMIATPVLDIPLLMERNLDSLSRLEYPSRLLAFAIDLGQRNLDLDRRIGHILSAAEVTDNWHEGVELVITRENYRSAETQYLSYLGRYEILMTQAPAEWDSSRADLWSSMKRLSASYGVIRSHTQYDRLPALLDTLLSNDLYINRSLREFEAKIKKDVLP